MTKKEGPPGENEGKANAILVLGFSTGIFVWLDKPSLHGSLAAIFFMLLAIIAVIFLKTKF